jgi:hypothetical protein
MTKNADLFVAWRYVAAMPRLPKKFLQPFPAYGWRDRDERITRPTAEKPDSVGVRRANQSIAHDANLP